MQPRPKSVNTARRGGHDFTCTFCGLLCDDLTLSFTGPEQVQLSKPCERAQTALAGLRHTGQPRIAGKRAGLEEALAAAAGILQRSRQPLVSGLGTDVNGVRAALELAERCGACVEHGTSASLLRNILPLQARGAFNVTFAEVRNRAATVLMLGTDGTAWPRLHERLFSAGKTLTGLTDDERRIICIGAKLAPPKRRGTRVLKARNRDLTEITGALLRLYRGEQLPGPRVAGVPVADLAGVAEQLRSAPYSVIVWSASSLEESGGDLTVEAILALIREVNREQRCGGLPLGGNGGATTAVNVCTWQSGYPTRFSYAGGAPDYQPHSLDSQALLDAGAADAMLWINAWPGTMKPPQTSLPVIALTAAGERWRQRPAVEIPIGVPGIHHVGTAFRVDSAVSLPLQAPFSGELPAASEVLERLRALL